MLQADSLALPLLFLLCQESEERGLSSRAIRSNCPTVLLLAGTAHWPGEYGKAVLSPGCPRRLQACRAGALRHVQEPANQPAPRAHVVRPGSPHEEAHRCLSWELSRVQSSGIRQLKKSETYAVQKSSLLSDAGSLGMLALACAPSTASATNHAVCRRFTDFPFTTEVVRDSRDARRFCGHAEVLAYLDAFAEFYALRPHIRYGRRVLRTLPLWRDQHDEGSGPRWRVTTCAASNASQVCRCALGAPAACIVL